MNDAPLLELVDVSVERDANRILDRVSLVIPRGRHTAVLGPNGSGKSSLLKVLLRQFYPSVESDGHQGTVRILGQSEWVVSELRRKMGIVSSTLDFEFSLGRTGRMTVVEAVASGLTSTQLVEFGVEINEDVRQAVDIALARVEQQHLANRHVDTLSTGERRRVLIARAIINEPEILVLDEPTSGLDFVASFRFLELLRGLVQQDDVTLVLVTHHIEEILPEIEHVVLLDQGRTVADDAKSNVMTSDRLSELYRFPIKIQQHANGFFSGVTTS